MAIFRHVDGKKWWISIYRGKGMKRKYIPTGTDDKDLAVAMEALAKRALRGNIQRDTFIAAMDALCGWESDKGTPIDALWLEYENSAPNVGKTTTRQRKSMCDLFVKWCAEHQPATKYIEHISTQQAYAFSKWLMEERPAKGKTHNNRIGDIKTVFGMIQARLGMDINPFAAVKPLDTSDSLSGRAFKPAEIKRLLKESRTAGHHWELISRIALYTGLRLGDIAQLKAEDIDGDIINLKPSKTAKHKITVKIPLHASLVPEIAALPKEGLLFPDQARWQKHKNYYYSDIIKAAKIDDKEAKITFHCWRHTFRTRLAAASVPQEIAMKLGGWTNESTAEIYNHDYSQLRAAIDALD